MINGKIPIALVMTFVFLFSVVSTFIIAQGDDNSDSSDSVSGSGEDRVREEIKRDFREDGRRIEIERKVEIIDGKRRIDIRRIITDEDGNKREVRIKIEERNGKRIIKIVGKEEFDVETELELETEFEENDSDLRALTSDGRKHKIKILPDRVSEIAIERLRSKNFTIELKEVLHRNIPRVIYNIETNKNGRFLGIFKLKLKVEGQIDPETGEVIDVVKPWWAFLVTGEDSDQTEEGDENLRKDKNRITVEIISENDSGESGRARLVEENGQVILTISMDGAPEDVSQPAHIHLGSCPEVGGVQYPLTNILNGESITTIDVTLDQLKSELPLAINIHKSVDEASVYVSCGNLIFN